MEGYLANILESADEGTEDNEEIINTLNSIADKAKGGTGEVPVPTPTAAPSDDKSVASDGNKAKYENIRISDYEKATFEKAKEENLNILGITVYLQDSCILKAARAFLVFKCLEELGEVMKAEPNVQDIEDEKFDYDFSLVYFTKESAEKVKAAIENVSEIKEAVVGTFKVQLEGAEEAAHEETVQTEGKESKPVTKTEDKPKAQAAAAKQEPEKKALVWCNDHGEEKTFTFTDISRLSNQTANYFQSLGIRKGTVVMLILRRRWEYWVCAVALHKIGAILIPGSLQLAKKDLIYRGNSAQIHTMVCLDDKYVLEQVDEAQPSVPSIQHKIVVGGSHEGWRNFHEEVEKFSTEFARPTGDAGTKAHDLMLVYFTSGTTGDPKMVEHDYTHPLGHIVTAKYWQQVQENKLHMSVSDSGWAKFGWGKIYGQWICGAVIFAYDMDKFVPTHLLQKMQDYKLTTFCAPPTMYRFMLQEDVASYDLSSIQNFSTAGEPLNPEVYNRWQELTGKEIREGFGQTEGSVLLANFPWITPKPGSTGKPSPLYDIVLQHDDGTLAKDGEQGALVMQNLKKAYPTGLFVGYYKNPEMTQEILGGGSYCPHDVFMRDKDGYYWFVGRNDDVIKCSGYRIGPFEVESALIEHPAVLECAITAAPDPIRGQVVKATVVLTKGYTPSPELTKELQNHVKHTTAPYKYPRIIEYVDELPKTLGGKIKRAQIRKEDQAASEK